MIKDRIKSTKEKLSNPQNDYGKRYKITDYILFFLYFHSLDGSGKCV